MFRRLFKDKESGKKPDVVEKKQEIGTEMRDSRFGFYLLDDIEISVLARSHKIQDTGQIDIKQLISNIFEKEKDKNPCDLINIASLLIRIPEGEIENSLLYQSILNKSFYMLNYIVKDSSSYNALSYIIQRLLTEKINFDEKYFDNVIAKQDRTILDLMFKEFSNEQWKKIFEISSKGLLIPRLTLIPEFSGVSMLIDKLALCNLNNLCSLNSFLASRIKVMNLADVEKLLNAGVPVRYETHIKEAFKQDNFLLIKLLLTYVADENLQRYADLLFREAIQSKNWVRCKMILNCFVDNKNVSDRVVIQFYKSDFNAVIQEGDEELVRMLFDRYPKMIPVPVSQASPTKGQGVFDRKSSSSSPEVQNEPPVMVHLPPPGSQPK